MSSAPENDPNTDDATALIRRARSFEERRSWAVDNLDRMGIDWSKVPHPPWWAALWGPAGTERHHRSLVAENVLRLSATLSRPLTPTERDAAAQLVGKEHATMAYVWPVWLAAFVFATRRRDWWARATDQSRSALARLGGIGMRVAGYGLITGIPVIWFFGSYASTVYVADFVRDERLKDVRKDLGDMKRFLARGFERQRNQQRPREDGQGEAAEYEPMSDTTDGSRTIGEESESSNTYNDMPRQRGWPARGPQRQQAAPQTDDAASPPWSSRPSAQPQQDENPSGPGQDDGSIFDDASPVAPSQRQSQSTRQTQGSSAWDQIRRQSKVGPSDAPPQDRGQDDSGAWATVRQGSASQGGRDRVRDTSGDWSYSAARAERALSKEQAQKEFDAMLEREREGESDGRRGRR